MPFVCANVPRPRPFVRNIAPNVGKAEFASIRLSGFTLIELMITVALLVTLLALSTPTFSTFVANQRLSTQANELMADLMFARSEAVKRGIQTTVCKTTNPNAASPTCNTTDPDSWATGRVLFVDDDGDRNVDANEAILRIRQALDGAGAGGNVLLGDGADSGTANRVTFVASGATTLVAETELFLCDRRGDSQAVAVAIGPTGRARVTPKGKDRSGNDITACP